MFFQYLKTFFQKPGVFFLGDYHPDDLFKIATRAVIAQSKKIGVEKLFIEMIDSSAQEELDCILSGNKHLISARLDDLLQHWHYTPYSVTIIKEIITTANQVGIQVKGIDCKGSLQLRNEHWAQQILENHNERSIVFGGKNHLGKINRESADWECEGILQGVDEIVTMKYRSDWLAAATPIDTRLANPVIPRTDHGIKIHDQIILLPATFGTRRTPEMKRIFHTNHEILLDETRRHCKQRLGK
jgi:hypothetical protein